MMEPSTQQIEQFKETLFGFYAKNSRDTLPWRQPEPDGSFDPYKIMVSELMLQQTQVARVIPKYLDFLARFPTATDLAAVELGDVLRMWQGLGYNRRAKFLWQAAGEIYALGRFPTEQAELVKLPGIGTNTAGAIMAYAFNRPIVFIETNVRTVYIHHFLNDQQDVSDRDILGLLLQTVPWVEGKEQPETLALPKPGVMRKTTGLSHDENPREFYWALMDYGSHLKATVGNLNKVSKHYTKQSTFAGSKRQVRGQVIRLLGSGPQPLKLLKQEIPDGRLETVLAELEAEQLIRQNSGIYGL